MLLKLGLFPPTPPKDINDQLHLQVPDFGLGESQSNRTEPAAMKATWLGHACFLLELAAPTGSERGPRILFDPVFVHRCSPFQFMGPGRYTGRPNSFTKHPVMTVPVSYEDPPCKLEDIPSVDIVVISHNHYDHLDTTSISTLDRLHHPHFFAPLGNGASFKSLGIPAERTHIMDWWETRDVAVEGKETHASFKIICTPSQHFTGRGVFDRFKTLWASWAVVDDHTGAKAWFGGDTAYRTVREGDNEDDVPFCPEFQNIGNKLGPFDLAMIPIG